MDWIGVYTSLTPLRSQDADEVHTQIWELASVAGPGILITPMSLMGMWVCSVGRGNVEIINKPLKSQVISMMSPMHQYTNGISVDI